MQKVVYVVCYLLIYLELHDSWDLHSTSVISGHLFTGGSYIQTFSPESLEAFFVFFTTTAAALSSITPQCLLNSATSDSQTSADKQQFDGYELFSGR